MRRASWSPILFIRFWVAVVWFVLFFWVGRDGLVITFSLTWPSCSTVGLVITCAARCRGQPATTRICCSFFWAGRAGPEAPLPPRCWSPWVTVGSFLPVLALPSLHPTSRVTACASLAGRCWPLVFCWGSIASLCAGIPQSWMGIFRGVLKSCLVSFLLVLRPPVGFLEALRVIACSLARARGRACLPCCRLPFDGLPDETSSAE